MSDAPQEEEIEIAEYTYFPVSVARLQSVPVNPQSASLVSLDVHYLPIHRCKGGKLSLIRQINRRKI